MVSGRESPRRQYMSEPGSPSKQPQAPRALPEVLGESVGLTNLRAQVAHLLGRQGHGRSLPTLLIQGETGTGKGLLARAIHQASIRTTRPFVDIDCASIPETLLEAELFGVERGAFTDARETKLGLFQTASGGTIFLDEVGLLPRSLQGKLLKVVEERGVRRLGSTHTEVVDLWVLAATNVDLKAATRDGSFRQDLYHRLAAVTLMIPPLRARDGDILLLAEHFLARACTEYRLPPKVLVPDAQAAMLAYAWPGNVRELANMLERVVLLSGEDTVISAELLALPAAPAAAPMRSAQREPPRHRSLVEGFERDRLLEALKGARGNITAAAARLGLPRNTLRYRMDKLGISAEEPGETPLRPRKSLAKIGASSPASDLPVRPATSTGREETRVVSLLRAEVREADGQPGQSDRVLEFIAAKVQSFGGRVEAVKGSLLMATFGVYPCEEPVSRAAHTAISVSKVGTRPAAVGWKPGTVQIAIHASEASVRCFKGSFVMDEKHRQHAEGVLQAILSSAEPEAMLVSQSAAPLLRDHFDLEPVTVATSDAGSAFHLVGHHWPDRDPKQHPPNPFVGRQHELELLERLFAQAEAGRGQVVGIVGEPGAGKSRLLHEFRQRLADRRFAYHAVKCLPYGRGTADLIAVEVLKQAWGIADGDVSAVIVEKVRHALESVGMDPDRWAPDLLTLFRISVGGEQLEGLSRRELKVRVFDALRRVAVEKSRREPLIIAVDDVQWFGHTPREFLGYLVENLPSARILLLTTYRPDYQPPWVRKSYLTQLTLPPLSSANSLAILRTFIPGGRSADRLVSAILEKAEGNPFFLEELARSAVAGDSELDLPVPEAVRALLVARMGRLGDDARRLLHVASVIGRRVPARLLELFCEEPVRIEERIAECKRLEFLDEEIVEGEPVYVFKHALVREVAYHSLTLIDRRALHAAAGRALESLHSDRLQELRDLLAQHYAKSKDRFEDA